MERKKMTKKQLKERALLLFSFSFILEGLNQIDLIDEKTKNIKEDISKAEDKDDLLALVLYKKLKRLRPSFTNKKVVDFFFKRINKINDDLSQDCQPILMGLIGVFFYQKFKRTNEFDLGIRPSEIEKAFFNLIKDGFNVNDCTIDKSIEIIRSIYPDESGMIEFYKLSNRFPFNIKIKDEKC
jgi:hypothetical protein